jgi:hypothetical protein
LKKKINAFFANSCPHNDVKWSVKGLRLNLNQFKNNESVWKIEYESVCLICFLIFFFWFQYSAVHFWWLYKTAWFHQLELKNFCKQMILRECFLLQTPNLSIQQVMTHYKFWTAMRMRKINSCVFRSLFYSIICHSRSILLHEIMPNIVTQYHYTFTG